MVILKFDEYVISKFTREKGFTEIHSNKHDRKKSISLLNNFIPQGASPRGSVRLTYVDESTLGVGYYKMIDHSNASIHTLLAKINENKFERFLPTLKYHFNDMVDPLNINMVMKYEDHLTYSLLENFGLKKSASILYSYLTGDNILLVTEKNDLRLNFIRTLLSISPNLIFTYNRITTGCMELDGNENIVSVNKLPRKYRSHKKLFLPLDTIFIDLENRYVEGEGVKYSEYTEYLVDILSRGSDGAFTELKHFFENIVNRKPSIQRNFGEIDLSLISRIESKLRRRPSKQEEWIMF
ncbi:MAG: hypothetical protein IH840_08690 [Candidatus Heimdallarchaeota archaeon]|nr:hypothetical protein [Candidatus Heimdallarchaeota archaeon]